MPGLTISEQIECVRREIELRERVYARWVPAGKMKQTKADYELAAMQAVLETLERVAKTEPFSLA